MEYFQWNTSNGILHSVLIDTVNGGCSNLRPLMVELGRRAVSSAGMRRRKMEGRERWEGERDGRRGEMQGESKR